ncbi:hypothetical protein [Ruminococcus flavefaciens]|uniref:hypothetical protein n=1 Tax=Ruminococcus flavefaciens TaxID=1265 RepID=UPI001587E45D|nr:hypothetical protein [Ruminococcus flavefaciens]
MVGDNRTEIRSKAFKSFFVENRCGAGYGEFGIVVETVTPDCRYLRSVYHG